MPLSVIMQQSNDLDSSSTSISNKARALAAPSFVPSSHSENENSPFNAAAPPDEVKTAVKVDFRSHSFPPLDPRPGSNPKKYLGPTPESNWVIPGMLLVGAYPASQSDSETFDLLTSILKHGIRKFVCLQLEYIPNVTEDDWRSGAALRPYYEDVRQIVRDKHKHNLPLIADEASISFEHCPIVDCGVTDDSKVLALSEKLVEDLSRGEVIYLHCWGGHGRTGTIVSIMLHLMYGLGPKEAMQQCQMVHDLRWCPVGVGSPQTQQQRDQVIRVINKLTRSYEKKQTSSEEQQQVMKGLSNSLDFSQESKKKSNFSRLSFNAIYDTFRGPRAAANNVQSASPNKEKASQLPKFNAGITSANKTPQGHFPNSKQTGDADSQDQPLFSSLPPFSPSHPKPAVSSNVRERNPPSSSSSRKADDSIRPAESTSSSSSSSSAIKPPLHSSPHAPPAPLSSISFPQGQSNRRANQIRNLSNSSIDYSHQVITPSGARVEELVPLQTGSIDILDINHNLSNSQDLAAQSQFSISTPDEEYKGPRGQTMSVELAQGLTPQEGIVMTEQPQEASREHAIIGSQSSLHIALMEARKAVNESEGVKDETDQKITAVASMDTEVEDKSLVPVPPKGFSSKKSHPQQFYKQK